MGPGRPRSLLVMSTSMLKTALGLLEQRLVAKEIDNKELGSIIRSLYVIQQRESEIAGKGVGGVLPNRYQKLKPLQVAPLVDIENPWSAEGELDGEEVGDVPSETITLPRESL